MKILLTVVGALAVLIGIVWMLQGFGVLPGSFMTGQIQWAIWGAVAALSGVVVILFARRGSSR